MTLTRSLAWSLLAVGLCSAMGCESNWQLAMHEMQEARRLAAAGPTLRDVAAIRFEQAAHLEPGLREAWVRAARLRLDEGCFADAERLSSEAVTVTHGASLYALELHARALVGLGRDEKAAAELSAAVDRDPSLQRLGFELGRVYERRGELVQALEAYRKAAAAAERDEDFDRAVALHVAMARVALAADADDAAALLDDAKDAAARVGSDRFSGELANLSAQVAAETTAASEAQRGVLMGTLVGEERGFAAVDCQGMLGCGGAVEGTNAAAMRRGRAPSGHD